MSKLIIASCAAAILCSACVEKEIGNQQATHNLVVAVHPDLGVTNHEVDSIISSMNKIINEKAERFGWDHACTNVSFVRKGDVIENEELMTTGSYSDLSRNLREKEPSANVLITEAIACGNVLGAVGCNRLGGEPLVVVTYDDSFSGQLWTHERGHGVGLHHSAENPATDQSEPEDIGMRFMFWRLGFGHTGKLRSECAAFVNTQLASVDHSPPAIGTPGIISAAAAAAGDDGQAELRQSAAEVGLTVQAMKVIGPPWEQVPVDEILALSPADLQSIRTMLRGNVNAYWAQAIMALGLRGTRDDLSLIRNSLETPARLGAARGVVDGAQLRNLMRAKLAAPQALGLLANRTRDNEAVRILDRTARLSQSIELVGPRNALALSVESLKGLAIANTEAAQQSLGAALEKADAPGALSRSAAVEMLSRSGDGRRMDSRAIAPLDVPALTESEKQSILNIQSKVRSGDIRSLLRPE